MRICWNKEAIRIFKERIEIKWKEMRGGSSVEEK